jgi:DNA repair protein RadD
MRHKAHNWWRARSMEEPPQTIDEALEKTYTLRRVKQIRVWTNKRYPEIVSYEYHT